MRRLLILGAFLGLVPSLGVSGPAFYLPRFPVPSLVRNQFGELREMGFLAFLRQLQNGGVVELNDVDFVDQSYAVVQSGSLPGLAAWLEAASHSVGVDLPRARQGVYDGMAYARLLEVAMSLASLGRESEPVAIPIGVAICHRRQAWGELPADGARDAYLLVATERGLLVYDPPTRQLAPLADFPNHADVFKVQF